MLLVLRCATMVGVCVEAVAAVAWIAELFPSSRRRERILSYTQACYPVGGILVSIAYYLAVTYGHAFPPVLGTHDAWRYTLLSGLIPAFPLLVLRPLLPESPLWRSNQRDGMPRRPQLSELLQPEMRRQTILITIAAAATLSLPYGALQHTPRIVPASSKQFAASPRGSAAAGQRRVLRTRGRIGGRAVVLLCRGPQVCQPPPAATGLVVPALVVFLWAFCFVPRQSRWIHGGVFFAQAIFNGLHSFWGNYLLECFRRTCAAPAKVRHESRRSRARRQRRDGDDAIGECDAGEQCRCRSHSAGTTASRP